MQIWHTTGGKTCKISAVWPPVARKLNRGGCHLHALSDKLIFEFTIFTHKELDLL